MTEKRSLTPRSSITAVDFHKLGVRISFKDGSWETYDNKTAIEILWGALRDGIPSETACEIDRLKEALRQVKARVVGERVPDWDGDGAVYQMRGRIADICDVALAHPHHPRDMHLTVETKAWVPIAEARPESHRRLLVTNNINARDAFGRMSHVWLVRMIHEPSETDHEHEGWIAFDDSDRIIESLTHWRYAL